VSIRLGVNDAPFLAEILRYNTIARANVAIETKVNVTARPTQVDPHASSPFTGATKAFEFDGEMVLDGDNEGLNDLLFDEGAADGTDDGTDGAGATEDSSYSSYSTDGERVITIGAEDGNVVVGDNVMGVLVGLGVGEGFKLGR